MLKEKGASGAGRASNAGILKQGDLEKLNPHVSEKVDIVMPFHVDEERDYSAQFSKIIQPAQVEVPTKIVPAPYIKPEKPPKHDTREKQPVASTKDEKDIVIIPKPVDFEKPVPNIKKIKPV